MDAAVLIRIRRLHAALGRVLERDLSKFPARICASGGARVMVQDFSGGATEVQLSDALQGVIHNVASFHDHLQEWGRHHRVSTESIHNYMKNSREFCIIRDLWNNEKHGGYPPRRDGWSKMAPRVQAARRVMRLTTGPKCNSTVGLTIGNNGQPIAWGDGRAEVVVTAEVVDRQGNGLGEAHELIEKSVRVCEAALRQFNA